nr:PREDICTED: hydrocephalus-inducing protein homolog [Latimeria chalumnae]|eukprot:XP_014353540.1 PREDICTED: hydrocephalus-inducing protein homolog [Latimeria chalumnae]
MVFTLLDSPKAEEIIRKSYVYVSIFFPHPDGTGILYILHGMADPPKAVATINREMPSKTVYTEVTFRNEVTQEYLHYVVNFKALSPGMLSTIELVTVIRQSTSSMVKVENPLSIPVTFTVDCKTQDISFPLQLTVPAQSEGSLMFEQLPLRPREFTGRIALQTNELGLFQYGLLLKAIPARSEKPMYFGTFLGKSQGVSAKIMNYCRQQVEFTCKIEGSYFHIEKTIYTAPGSLCGTKISIEVTYEPSQIGESRGVLNISSPVAGEYVIPLFGTCSTPKPQGPFVVVTGANTSISFNNIFPQTTAFTYQVDNPVFSVKASETIHFKKSHSISVSYEGNPNGTKTPSTGRLFVSCPRFTGMGQNITWVYYLKGIPSEK